MFFTGIKSVSPKGKSYASICMNSSFDYSRLPHMWLYSSQKMIVISIQLFTCKLYFFHFSHAYIVEVNLLTPKLPKEG